MTDKPMSGLETLRAIINGELPHPSIAATIPMVFVEADAGRVLFEARAGERHLNPLGGVHGGFIA
ncbi:MAG: acyl-coenzyme A thioesterase PaaI-like protein, partial [Gammaproteobacteria bacterium]